MEKYAGDVVVRKYGDVMIILLSADMRKVLPLKKGDVVHIEITKPDGHSTASEQPNIGNFA